MTGDGPVRELQATPVRIQEGAAEHPDKPRFFLPSPSGWTPVTWAEVDIAVREVGLGLASEGLPREAPVCIYAPNRLEWLYAGLGAQAAGGAMVPIYPSSTAEQAGYVVKHSECFAVFVDTQPLLERLLASGALDGVRRIILLGAGHDLEAALAAARSGGAELPSDIEARISSFEELRAKGRGPNSVQAYTELLAKIERKHRCLMLYTSGTTGHPKGVPLTYENVSSSTEDWLSVLGPSIPEDAVDLFWLPMSHIYGWGEAGLGFELGFTSYLTTPREVIGLFESIRPSVFMSVPAYWEKLAAGALSVPPEERAERLRKDCGGRLQFCLSGGAGLDKAIKELFHMAGLFIIEGYGLTEAAPTLTMNRPHDFRFDSVGKPFPRVELRLAEDGEIQARGPNVFGGYFKDPEATKKTFTEDGWLATGDLGQWTEDGFLQIIGRKKEILVTAGGKNIPPANIEVHFATDELIEHLVVYGDGKKYLVAGVWPSALARDGYTEAELQAEVERRVNLVNERLAKHETVKKVALMEPALTVESGLVTPTLKVKRKKIYEAYRDQFEALYS